jgi:hypothetical protein
LVVTGAQRITNIGFYVTKQIMHSSSLMKEKKLGEGAGTKRAIYAG